MRHVSMRFPLAALRASLFAGLAPLALVACAGLHADGDPSNEGDEHTESAASAQTTCSASCSYGCLAGIASGCCGGRGQTICINNGYSNCGPGLYYDLDTTHCEASSCSYGHVVGYPSSCCGDDGQTVCDGGGYSACAPWAFYNSFTTRCEDYCSGSASYDTGSGRCTPTAALYINPDVKYSDNFRLGSHNTYDKNLALSDYEDVTGIKITTTPGQALDAGAESIEFDIYEDFNYYSEWYVSHVAWAGSGPFKNTCSGGGRLSDCLADVWAWHVSHPNHRAINVIIDKKQGFNFSPPYSSYGPGDLDAYISRQIPAPSIFKPSDLKGSYASVREAAQANAWPTDRALTGKLVFTMTGSKGNLNTYVDGRATPLVFIQPETKSASDISSGSAISEFTSDANWKQVAFYNFHFEDVNNAGTGAAIGQALGENHFMGRVYFVDGGYVTPNNETDANYRTAVNAWRMNFVGLKRFNRVAGWNGGVESGSRLPTPAFDTTSTLLYQPSNDWNPGRYKASCPAGVPVRGLSRAPNTLASHSALCRPDPSDAAVANKFSNAGCTYRSWRTTSGDNRGNTSTGDWQPGAFKMECAANEYVAGVSQSASGAFDGIYCCPGTSFTNNSTTCSQLALGSSDQRENGESGDWAQSYYKTECGESRHVAGIAVNQAAGYPANTVLCCTDGWIDIARGKSVSATGSYGVHGAAAAVDGDPATSWNSGQPASEVPQIKIDLGSTRAFDRIELLVDQSPAGQTTHTVYGSNDNVNFTPLHTFSGVTASDQTLAYSFPTSQSYRWVAVVTWASPSWVAWKEVRILR